VDLDAPGARRRLEERLFDVNVQATPSLVVIFSILVLIFSINRQLFFLATDRLYFSHELITNPSQTRAGGRARRMIWRALVYGAANVMREQAAAELPDGRLPTDVAEQIVQFLPSDAQQLLPFRSGYPRD
jgi:hypothetical protein